MDYAAECHQVLGANLNSSESGATGNGTAKVWQTLQASFMKHVREPTPLQSADHSPIAKQLTISRSSRAAAGPESPSR